MKMSKKKVVKGKPPADRDDRLEKKRKRKMKYSRWASGPMPKEV